MGPKTVLRALLVSLLLTLLGCGGGAQSSSPAPHPAPAAASLTSITVTPPSAQLPEGATQQFTATGQYSDGSTRDLSTSVTWVSSAPLVVGIAGSGMAWASQVGTAEVTASEGSVHGAASLIVSVAPLISISITPSTPSLPAGTSLQLKAVGLYQDGGTQDLTSAVSWVSSAPGVAQVSTSGLLAGEKMGTARVVASQGAVTGSVSVTVTPAALASLTVGPGTASIAKQTTQQFSAMGVFTDGSRRDVTSTVTWTSSSSSVASVQAGLATGLAPGTATITAVSGNISASAQLTVTNATAVSLALTPANPTLVVGLFQQFTVTATFSDGTTQNINGVATWASSAASIAATNTAGLVCGISPGSTVISAGFEQLSSSSMLAVNAPSLVSISITPASATIAATTEERFYVIGNYNDGSTQLLNGATWSSSDPGVASMNGNLATGQQPGTVTISASLNSFTASATLAVTSATLVSIAVTPVNTSIAPGTVEGFSAVGTFSDGTTQNITQSANWTSSNSAVAAMNGNNATALAAGTTAIGAAFDGIAGSSGLTVTAVSMTSLSISPTDPVIVPGLSQQFSAVAVFSDGSTHDVTTAVAWKTSQSTVANISGGGTATGLAPGTTTVSATYNGVTVSTGLTVSGASLMSLSVSPASTTIAPGLSQQFSAIGAYSDGTVQNVTSIAHWTSSDSSIASVSNSGNIGVATGIAEGWTRVSAVLDSLVAAAVLNVNSATLVSLTITPADPSLSLGANQQFAATGTFSDGSTQDMTQWVTWSTSNVQVCTINGSGLATTSGSGTATIRASFQSVAATTTLTVY